LSFLSVKSEISEKSGKKMTELTPAMQNFILHWGEMGSSWGINRTVAQIYAMLYLSPKPLTADEICEALSLARSTVSTGLRELHGWGVVRILHVFGDRRDHFETMHDIWEMFRVILNERKRREFDPTLDVLRKTVSSLSEDNSSDKFAKEKVAEMLDLFETITSAYNQVEKMPTESIKKMAKLGDGLAKIIGLVTQE
jgi:DNA-binding transcriptional regulator GbsR (MarR family)